MSLTKQLMTRRSTLTLFTVLLRLYRKLIFGGFLFEHDRRLHRFMRTREPALFAVWHQDFPFTLGYLSRWNARRKTYALASASRDGGLATAAAVGVGFQRPVRGSSARGGAKALLGLHRLLKDERDASVVIVCDGPRPPAREMKPGVVQLAQKTGRPIWLVRTSYRRKDVLHKSWARFFIPRPWSRAVCVADGPFYVPRELDRDAFEATRKDLEDRLNVLADRADARIERM